MAIKLIIFDLDGTLVDSIVDITNALNESVRELGIPPFSIGAVREMVGSGVSSLVERALGDERRHLKETTVQRLVDYYAAHTVDDTRVYPGVRDVLEQLSRFKRCVLTNKRQSLAIKTLEGLNLTHSIDEILGSANGYKKKPSPEPVNALLARFNVHPEEAVIVGDSEVDIRAGKSAGVHTIAVTWGYRERAFLIDADTIIDTIEALPARIDVL